MNWPEALTSIVALICGTAVVCLLVYLRRQQQETDKLAEVDGHRFEPMPITPLEHREENVRLIAAETPRNGTPGSETPGWSASTETEPQTATEAYDASVTDLDNLAERLERIERNLQGKE